MSRWMLFPAIAALSMALAAAPAKATPLLSIHYGTTTTVDTLGSGFIPAVIGSGAFKGSSFIATSVGSESQPAIMLVGSIEASQHSTMVFQITQTKNPNSGSNWLFDSEFSESTPKINAPGISISIASYYGNGAFDTSHLLSSTTFPATGGMSDLTNDVALTANHFSITEIVTISATGNGEYGAFTALLTGVDPVPEPASLALLGGGLISLGAIRRRKLKQA